MSTNIIHVAPIAPGYPVKNSKKCRIFVMVIGFLVILIGIVLLLYFRDCLNGPCLKGVKNPLACASGYSGIKCDININECASSPCKNGGNCTDGVNGYTCTCTAGYSGIHCDVNINECASSPCQNGGTCTDGVNGYTCTCVAGYSGSHCDVNINECASSPCKNGKMCTDGVNEYTCACPAGYTGINCDVNINECASSPCQNGGKCTDGVNKYLCACASGYRGINCDININECASSPCQTGGNCTDGVNGYTCTCPAGYSGVHCETNIINECASNPCGANSLSCTDLLNAYNCTCKAGFGGKRCEVDLGCSGKGWFTEDTGNIKRPLIIDQECAKNPNYLPRTPVDCKYEIVMDTTKNISFHFSSWSFRYGRDDVCTSALQYADFYVNDETTAAKRVCQKNAGKVIKVWFLAKKVTLKMMLSSYLNACVTMSGKYTAV